VAIYAAKDKANLFTWWMAFSLAAKCMKSSSPITPSPSMSRISSAGPASRMAVRSPDKRGGDGREEKVRGRREGREKRGEKGG
jgi:hypothetical protein